jgi:hypothetical protein
LLRFERIEQRHYEMLRIPVIPATQSGAKLPPNPKEACHAIRTKAAPLGPPSERSDA